MLPAPGANMDRAGRKRKNGEVTALVDLIEWVRGAPGTAASPLSAAADPSSRRRNPPPGTAPKSGQIRALKTPRFQGGFKPPKPPLNRRFTDRNHLANARIHHYFLPRRCAPSADDRSPQPLDSTPLRPPESDIVRKYVYFLPPTSVTIGGMAHLSRSSVRLRGSHSEPGRSCSWKQPSSLSGFGRMR